MRRVLISIVAWSLVICLVLGGRSAAAAQNLPDSYRNDANRLIEAALSDSAAYDRLTDLVDCFGHRHSGSVSLERALDWILEEMKADPHWVRGEESLEMIRSLARTLPMLGLGGSIATSPGGIRAEVLVVGSFEELGERADDANGRIVLFNVPFTTYGKIVQYRSRGAIAAARVGAVASLIRSVTPYSQQTPHTGAMSYQDGVTRIPHAAITVEDAEWIQRMSDRGVRVEAHLRMNARTLPDVPSRNVVAEIVGSEFPDEVVVLGGHIDSWDVGQGAMDDGGGSVAAWEAVRLMKELGLRPRRTVRVVLWTNEENGTAGGRGYRDAHRNELDDHILAMESGGGVFKPSGFGFTGSDDAFAIMQQIGTLLESIESGVITRGGGGADIGPIMREGVPGMGLSVDGTRYFWYHHTDSDTIDKLDPREMGLCVATMAVMAYVVADMPERLPR